RVAGTVRQNEAVGLIEERVPVPVPWNADDGSSVFEHASDDVLLGAGVDDQDAQPAISVVGDLRRWSAIEHPRHVDGSRLDAAGALLAVVAQQLTLDRALRSQMTREAARVDPGDSRHSLASEP